MIVSRFLVMAALVVGAPLSAQDVPSAPVDSATAALPDPDRLAIAERLVDRIWPVGTMHRMMESTMASTVDAAAGMEELAVDWADGGDKAERRAQHEARTGRPLRRTPPPETTTTEPSMAELNAIMEPLFAEMEPPMRVALARIYARRYSVEQLGELDSFFATPTGAAYAADSLTLMNDPEMAAAMTEAMSAMMSAMPKSMTGAYSEEAAVEAAAAAADAGVVKYE